MPKITMSWANITPNAKKYVKNVLDRGWLSYSLYQPRFERDVAYIHGAKHGILVSSGTDALRISLATLKEINQWPDQSEVIVPAVTFVATVNAVIQAGLKPCFADVVLSTANLNYAKLPLTRKTVAVVPVHLFGNPVAVKPIPKISTVEDSCETFGVHKLVGDMACFSFYVSHHLSCGVGGMILTNDDRYEKVCRSFMNHGRSSNQDKFEFLRSGYSSRITEMEAALGIAALETFRKDLIKRRKLADDYMEHLSGMDQLLMPPMDYSHSWMFFPVLMHEGNREKLMNFLLLNEVESRQAMPLIDQKCYSGLYKKGSCPNAEIWTRNGLLLPLHPMMDSRQVGRVAEAVKRFYR